MTFWGELCTLIKFSLKHSPKFCFFWFILWYQRFVASIQLFLCVVYNMSCFAGTVCISTIVKSVFEFKRKHFLLRRLSYTRNRWTLYFVELNIPLVARRIVRAQYCLVLFSSYMYNLNVKCGVHIRYLYHAFFKKFRCQLSHSQNIGDRGGEIPAGQQHCSLYNKLHVIMTVTKVAPRLQFINFSLSTLCG